MHIVLITDGFSHVMEVVGPFNSEREATRWAAQWGGEVSKTTLPDLADQETGRVTQEG